MFLDPRIHPAALTDQDLETLQIFGVRGVLVVADASAHPPTPEGIFAHFDELIGTQIPRLEKSGLRAWAALGVHPRVLPHRGLGQVLEALPGYFKSGKVVALGQLGLSKGDEREEEALLEQLALAHQFNRAAIVSAPGLDKERVTRRLLAALQRSELQPGRILVDGAVGKTVRVIRELGYYAGLTLHPDHLTVEKAVALVRALGPERLVLDTAAGDGASDILALGRAAHRLSRAGLSTKVIRRVTLDNAASLFGVHPQDGAFCTLRSALAADSPEQTVVVHVTPGEILDQRWRIETRIGQGAMGSVFRGRDMLANKIVAIKILAPEHCRKPKVVARFEREASKMTSLRHNNIVAFHGHGRRGALPFIVMEFLEGLTLSDVLEKHGGKIGINETVAIVKQICSGLAFLHANGLVHRDVKPQNVFLGVGGRVIILDLGVVRDQANPGLTRPGAMVGTPYYMSPEQILGVEDIDQRTDVYALAAVTFELLTGRPPYLGNNNFEVLYGHKNLPPPDANALVRTIPKKVSEVLIHGMSKRRDARYESVITFLAELEAAAGARRIDLAKAFNVAPITAEKTRLLAKIKDPPKPPPPIRADSGEVPEASNSDVLSVPGMPMSATGLSGEQKTVIHRFDKNERTFVGQQPGEADERTRASGVEGAAPTSGQLRVVVTARGRAAAATVFVGGEKKAVTPCTLTLAAGPHRIRIELEGFRAIERWSDVTAGTSTNLRVFMEKV